MNLTAVTLAALLVCRAPLEAAQDPVFERVEVGVTAIAGRSVFLDKGREAGVRRGDTVYLFPPGSPAIEGTVRTVSRSSSRATFTGIATLGVGDRGEVLVPAARLAPVVPEPEEEAPVSEPEQGVGPGKPRRPRPLKPVWQDPPEDWDVTRPLLAPSIAREPEARDAVLTGRVWTRSLFTRDESSGESDYASWRSGVDAILVNPFGKAGELELDLEYSQRSSDVDDTFTTKDRVTRLERLSYQQGGLRGAPVHWQVGRFLPRAFPELGLLDGAEYSVRREGGDVFGATLGFLPEPVDELDSGEDFQTSLFYRYVAGPEEELALGAAFQKTWHRGESDRDLLVLTGDWRASESTDLYGSAWVDAYTAEDVGKPEGLELTQLFFNANHRLSERSGLGLIVSHIELPSLLRDELPDVLPGIEDFPVRRAGLTGWRELAEGVRLHARADHWEDERESGEGGELRVDLRDRLYDRGVVSLALFDNNGSTSSGLGWRLSMNRRLSNGFLGLVWQSTEFRPADLDGGPTAELQHNVLRASYDTSFYESWDLSLFLEERSGDEQDSTALGIFLQRRF